MMGENDEAIKWCLAGLEQCEKSETQYYENSLRFHLTVALSNRSLFHDARVEAEKLPNGYEAHLHNKGITTKEELIKACEFATARSGPKIVKFDDGDEVT